MNYQTVKSSNIKALAHKETTLGVRFHGGTEYHYSNVPAELFTQLIQAASVGRTFNQLIKSNSTEYPHLQVA
jgi:KTSC domain